MKGRQKIRTYNSLENENSKFYLQRVLNKSVPINVDFEQIEDLNGLSLMVIKKLKRFKQLLVSRKLKDKDSKEKIIRLENLVGKNNVDFLCLASSLLRKKKMDERMIKKADHIFKTISLFNIEM